MGQLHEDITGRILEAAFEVINELGAGFLESVYENALALALEEKGLNVRQQHPLDVRFKGRRVGSFTCDIIVEDKVIVEVKAVQKLHPAHQAQIINYLTATGLSVGLLINFGTLKLEYRRLRNKNLSSK